MTASKIGALAALSLCLVSASALADETPAAPKQPAPAATPAPVAAAKPAVAKPAAAKPEAANPEAAKAAKKGEITIRVKIYGRRQVPSASIDVARLVPRAPLPQLRKPLVDRIGAAVDSAPF